MGLDPETRAWVEAVSGRRLDRVEPLVGGQSSEVHRGQLGSETVVIRHIVDRAWLAREPDLIDREAEILGLLAGTAVPAPRLLASDSPSGRLLMSFLPGAVRAGAGHLRAQVETMAEMAASIAAVALPDGHGLPPWRSWVAPDPVPPTWGDEAVWRASIEAYLGVDQPRAAGPSLLHRDLHPLNLLWRDDHIVGVVDWVNACVGHPHAELGHCRWNLAVLAGLDAADRFLAHYLAVTGSGPYDHWWDLAAVLSLIAWPVTTDPWHAVGRTDITPSSALTAIEAFLQGALAHR
jgi:aminoglycoside phosphotransferase (APT) family kinase protein